MKPVTVQYGGRVVSRDRRQASVIEEVPLGFIRRMLMALVEDPVTLGSESPIPIRFTKTQGYKKGGSILSEGKRRRQPGNALQRFPSCTSRKMEVK